MTTTAVTNPFQACLHIILKPNGVFDTLEDTKNWSWIPFLLISIAAVFSNVYYLNSVDFEWYFNNVLLSQSGDLAPAQIEQQRAIFTEATTKVTAYVAPLLFIIASLVLALYLNLSTKADEENINGFSDWFGFTWWVKLPAVIHSLVGSLLVFLHSGNEINPAILAPSSVAYIFGISPEHNWFGLLQSINLVNVWTAYLIAVGVNRWTELGTKKSTTIAAIYLLVLLALSSVF